MKNKLIILISALSISFMTIGQQADKEKYFKEFKKTIEDIKFPSFQGGNLKFNACRFEVNLNNSKDSLIVQRIKIPEKDYSDPSNDKEIRSVALSDIDKDSISLEVHDDFCFFKIFCKNKSKNIKYSLITGKNIDIVYDSSMGIGRFYRKDFSKKQMDHLVELLKDYLQ
ncbi:MAG: hypothetical protein ACLQQ4_15465 [Bacteroidia bacterium]